MNNVYFCSDFHFCHDRDFIYKPRGFDSVYEMNEQIIKNFKVAILSHLFYVSYKYFLSFSY